MCCKNFWKRIVPFFLALIVGLLVVNILKREIAANKSQENIKSTDKIRHSNFGFSSEKGTGIATGCHGRKFDTSIKNKPLVTSNSFVKKLEILSQPIPQYTNKARENKTEGVVRLRIAFTASGQIGNITSTNNLPDGLTEQAIAAARQIKFEPATRDGQPTTIVRIVEYNFTIY